MRFFVLVGVLSGVVVIAAVSVFLVIANTEAGAAPNYSMGNLDGVEYQAVDGRPLDLHSAVDRQIISGLPARDRRLRHGEALFAAFLSLSNTSSRPQRSANVIELRDEEGIARALPLPRSNPYAYFPSVLTGHETVPSPDSAAAENLAATGRVLVFRIQLGEYSNGGTFELIVHDPQRPSRTLSIIV